MIDWKARADELIEEYVLCCRAKPYDNTVDIQIEKDNCGKWATNLATQRSWGTELEVAEACYQLESRLKKLKEKVVIEILKNGSV
jgi:hypothetical protein